MTTLLPALNSFQMLRRFLIGGTLAIAVGITAPVQAQSGLLVGSSSDCDTFCVGGAQVKIERYHPSGLAHTFCSGRRPAVILLHGADGFSFNAHVYREAASNLAKAGYAAYVLHYFDVTPAIAAQGWVKPQAIAGDNFLAWQSALSAAIGYVAGQPGVDHTRIGLIGFSLGAYLSVAEGARNPQVATIVDFFGGVPKEAAKYIRHLPPTLIIHGDSDKTVPVSEALRLRDVLATRGVHHEMVIYRGVGHDLPKETQSEAAAKVLQFLKCNL